jgi:hypothetical protein
MEQAEYGNNDPMNLDEILSVSGKPGLYKLITQTRNGLLAESLDDQKRIAVSASQQVSSLKDIAIFTYSEEVPLAEVFASMMSYEEENGLPDPKAEKQVLIDFFAAILPEFDRERVYPSNIKKVLNWYFKLKEHQLLSDTEDESVDEATETDATDDSKASETPEVIGENDSD